MEGSNYWGYGYKTQHSYLKKARGEIWSKRSEKKQQKKENYQDEDKKSAIKTINSQI